MQPLFLVAIAAGVVWAFARPGTGLWLIVITGFGQELLRKVVPGQSAYWQGLVVAFALATFLGAWARRPSSWWRWREWGSVRRPVEIFLGVLIVQALVSYVKTGSLLLPAVGLVAYTGPLISVAIGSWLGRDARAIERVLYVYLLGAVLMASGIVLVQAGVTWEILKPIGSGLVVYTWERIELPSGFFRAPEVASWHSATGACVAVLLAILRRHDRILRNTLLAAGFAFMVFCVLATGRRKGLLEIAVFLVCFGLLYAVAGRNVGRFAKAGLFLVVIAGYALSRQDVMMRTRGSVEAMVGRETDPGGSGILRRLRQVGNDVPTMVERFGPLGLGLGTLTQGSRYFGADLRWGIASESGPYRLAVELGVAGVIVVVFMGLRLGSRMYRTLKSARSWPHARAVLASGLLALIAANGVVFLTAHQIFGDPFVFLWLGLLAGFAFTQIADGLAASRMAEPVCEAVPQQIDGGSRIPALKQRA